MMHEGSSKPALTPSRKKTSGVEEDVQEGHNKQGHNPSGPFRFTPTDPAMVSVVVIRCNASADFVPVGELRTTYQTAGINTDTRIAMTAV